ncbi:MAG: hypothetical protein Q9204_003961 [Flavoplaca sp. TL-2023a]
MALAKGPCISARKDCASAKGPCFSARKDCAFASERMRIRAIVADGVKEVMMRFSMSAASFERMVLGAFWGEEFLLVVLRSVREATRLTEEARQAINVTFDVMGNHEALLRKVREATYFQKTQILENFER